MIYCWSHAPCVAQVLLLAAAAGSLLVAFLALLQQMHAESRRRAREAREARARRLRYKVRGDGADGPAGRRASRLADEGQEVVLGEPRLEPPAKPTHPATRPIGTQAESFHLFLSHAWGTGQDQMRIVKLRLLEMLPDARIFLDVTTTAHTQSALHVYPHRAPSLTSSLGAMLSLCTVRGTYICGTQVDDLAEGKGAELVDASQLFLLFCSTGYFQVPRVTS